MEAIIFMGIQASGKSSFYFDKFSNTHLRLNLDMLKTRNRERILFDACIKSKQPLVIDNTNPTKEDRIKYIEKLKQNKFKIIGYYFNSSIKDCLDRNNQREGKKKIPEVAIKGTRNKLELPEYSEGFDELFYISLKTNGFDIKGWTDEI